jgi:hypothetical protein
MPEFFPACGLRVDLTGICSRGGRSRYRAASRGAEEGWVAAAVITVLVSGLSTGRLGRDAADAAAKEFSPEKSEKERALGLYRSFFEGLVVAATR